MSKLSCKIVSVELIIDTIYRVILLPNSCFSFKAGQYLMIIMDTYDKRPFSIASIPSEKKIIELHISASKINTYSMAVIERILNQNIIDIDIPYGNAWFRHGSQKPIILIAGGIGFSYIRSILYAILEENSNRNVILYWGCKKLKFIYDLNSLKLLSEKYCNIKIVPVIEKPDLNWKGRTGTVLKAVLDDFISLEKYEIYIAGRFEMVKNARNIFCNKRKALFNYFYSDAFEFI